MLRNISDKKNGRIYFKSKKTLDVSASLIGKRNISIFFPLVNGKVRKKKNVTTLKDRFFRMKRLIRKIVPTLRRRSRFDVTKRVLMRKSEPNVRSEYR